MSSRLKEKLVAAVAGVSLALGGVAVASAAVAADDTGAGEVQVESGSLAWGVKESFRNYLTGPIAHGSWELLNGASESNGVFSFPIVPGQVRAESTAFTGAVHFTGHNGILDLTISNPEIRGRGVDRVLYANVKSKAMGAAEAEDYGKVAFANVSFNQPEINAPNYSVSSKSVTLREEGVKPFASFYKAGMALDNLVVAFTTKTVHKPSEEPSTPGSDPSTPGADPSMPGTNPSTPGADPSTPSTPSNSVPGVTNDALTWGVKSSFIGMIDKFGGKIDPSAPAMYDSAAKVVKFALTEGQNLTKESEKIAFAGAVRFTAHGGVLDISISNPVLVKGEGEGNWILKATVASKPRTGGEVQNYGEIALADLSGVKLNVTDMAVTFTAPKVTVSSADALAAFGYSSAQEFAPLVANFSLTNTEQPMEVKAPFADSDDVARAIAENNLTPAEVVVEKGMKVALPFTNLEKNASVAIFTYSQPTRVPGIFTTDAEGKLTYELDSTNLSVGDHFAVARGLGETYMSSIVRVKVVEKSMPAPSDKPSVQPQAPQTPEAPTCKVDENQTRVNAGTFSWGIKQSFTTYIRGAIANGSWDLNGTSWDGSTFSFKASGGLFDKAAKSGTVYYSGSVHFTGHNGVLDLTIANPSVTINGNSGTLYATVSSSDTSGNKANYGRVALANVSFASVSVSGEKLSFATSSVALTAVGAKAFAGFYSAGTALDNFSGTASLVVNNECDPETGQHKVYDAFGKLAYTGAGVNAPALAALLLLVVGGIGVLARRKAEA